MFASLIRRNTRRYGGHLVHLGVIVIFIGMAGGAFNQSAEQELGRGQSMYIGGYRLECENYSRASNLNYDTDNALLNIYRGSHKIAQLVPERRFYVASQQPATIVANRSTLRDDLYVVFAGKEPDTQRPIIKVFLNPLVAWIWIGAAMILGGTAIVLAPLVHKSLRINSYQLRRSLYH
ncbi:cytochrome c-type biogenesis CcmF C-terminal domain-containing protein [Terriglobus tenax]|uniref:cytochrome c-type biogenesis CcmF C-terminal domain-containing protein n=1 Tax=Terriglobus tenax TaxID=1111115 RepID=UPI0021E02098|nr:cytochrome c-type biogenesis CcmF C-terminal domain-containing protein [Terriglobus tenax]